MNIDPSYIAPTVAAFASIFTLISSIINRNKISSLKVEIDGRMTELSRIAEESNLAKGRLEGMLEERSKPMIPQQVLTVIPAKVEVVNTPKDPVPIMPIKP